MSPRRRRHAGRPAEPRDTPPLFEEEDWSLRAWLRLLRDLYCSIDRRTLGFARILLGFLLITDLIHRGAAWRDMYSSVGVLPTPLNLQRPQAFGAFTIFNAFVSPEELQILWVIMAVNAVCLMVGYKTKVTQIVAFVLHVGMNGRILLIENGGYVVNNLLLLWTMFLPLGDRFSVDALLASLKRRRETTAADLNDRSDMLAPGMDGFHVSIAGLVLILQVGAIYYFNVIHKTGPAWRNGTAVHYVLYVDRMATPIIGALRGYLPDGLILFMTRATMAFEAGIPVLLLQPLARTWARRGVIFMMCTLHLAFGTTFVLGPFAWSLCVFACLLFTRDDWEIAVRTMRRAPRARTVVFDPRSGGALLACRLLKRLDRFELLTFAPEEGVPLGLGVRRPSTPGQVVGRSAMIADLVEALPLGPIVAWLPRLPGVHHVLDAACAALEKRDVSAWLGLRVDGTAGLDGGDPHTPGPAGSPGTGAPPDGAVDPRVAELSVVHGALAVGSVVRDLLRRVAARGQTERTLVSVVLFLALAWLWRAMVRAMVAALITMVGPEGLPNRGPFVIAVLLVGALGLRAALLVWRPGPRDELPPDTTPLGALACLAAILGVPGAVALAVHLDQPLPGVLMVLASVVIAGLVCAWVVFPTAGIRLLRRAAFGSVREALVLAMFAGAVNQGLTELWCINKRIKVPQPEALRLLSHKLRLLQGWFMFSPNPLTEDGTIVVDALTVDGRHVDPFTAREPHWELGGGSLGLTQIWCDYYNRIQLPANAAYREAMKEYMYRLPQRTGRSDDTIVSGEVFWVRQNSPRWSERTPYGYERAKLFSFVNPAAQPRASR